ncbi:MAG: hypothetical protein IPL60_18355 [Ardenticatenia bacterium]|nr:hypothetical protein [Ardenticatenia bacterium]
MPRVGAGLFAIVFLSGSMLAVSANIADSATVEGARQPYLNIVGEAPLVLARTPFPITRQPLSATQGGEEVAFLDFEGAVFPPNGWTLFDNVNLKAGRESRHAWSRQTCERASIVGGTASAWCSGGGLDGVKNPCGTNVGLGTEPWLQHPGIDISAYPAGIQIDLTVFMDTPVGQRILYVCAAEGGSRDFSCVTLSLPNEQLRATWLALQAPIYLPDTAGLSTVQVAFVYNDRDGAGDYPGVFIDNVKIEGLLEMPPTAETSPTATRRVTPTRTPTRPRQTATPSRTPTRLRTTATPTTRPTPTRGRWRTYIPDIGRAPTLTRTPTLTATATQPPPTSIPTQPPWPVTGDLVIEQANLLTDKDGDKKIVGRFRNNVPRWTHNIDVNIDMDLFGPGGRALGTASGLVAIKASGWGAVSCFDTYLDDNEQAAESFRIRTSVDDFFGDIGPRVHLEPFDVSMVPVSDSSYKVVGQVRNPHAFPVEDTGMMAITVFDGTGMAVECADVSTSVLQPGQSQVFETNWLHEKVGHLAAWVEVQGFVRPLGSNGSGR